MQKNDLFVESCFRDNEQSLDLKLLNNRKGLKKKIFNHDLCRPGLLLTGFTEIFANEKIQVFGNTEFYYLKNLPKIQRIEAYERLMSADIPCLFVANNAKIDQALLNISNKAGICVFASPHPTVEIFLVLLGYLNTKFAPRTTTHGTLVDVYGVGVLFTGKSGIGKSEIALDLVERGHRLVADDVVEIFRQREGVLIGSSRDLLRNMLEIRGLGLIDVWNTFGIRAIRLQKRVEVEVKLEDHKEIGDYDRLGTEKNFIEYLDVKIPLISLPIFPGKNITVISETIALKVMQRVYGFHPETDFMKKLNKQIKKNDSIRRYLDQDTE